MAEMNNKWDYTFTYRTDRTGTLYTCTSIDEFGSENDAAQAAREHAAALGVDVASVSCSKKGK